VQIEGDDDLGFGAVIGSVAGGVLGYQFGKGTGKTVAAVAGALAGGFVGKKTEERYSQKMAGEHIIVDLDNGVAIGVTQPVGAALRVGEQVRVEGSGPNARVVRR
jgi:outer membrane lipoprotein SlyB